MGNSETRFVPIDEYRNETGLTGEIGSSFGSSETAIKRWELIIDPYYYQSMRFTAINAEILSSGEDCVDEIKAIVLIDGKEFVFDRILYGLNEVEEDIQHKGRK